MKTGNESHLWKEMVILLLLCIISFLIYACTVGDKKIIYVDAQDKSRIEEELLRRAAEELVSSSPNSYRNYYKSESNPADNLTPENVSGSDICPGDLSNREPYNPEDYIGDLIPGSAIYKPVIYLCSDTDIDNMDINLSLPNNEWLKNIYPAFSYDTTWSISIKGNHIIKDGREYNYLFWDSEQGSFTPDFTNSFCVSSEEAEAFLEEKLAVLGLNDSEIDDFITFWIPRLKESPYNLISFQYDNYTEFAQITTNPKADTTIRVFMAFKPLQAPVECTGQDLKKAPLRTGITLVEWGGMKISE